MDIYILEFIKCILYDYIVLYDYDEIWCVKKISHFMKILLTFHKGLESSWNNLAKCSLYINSTHKKDIIICICAFNTYAF